MDSSAEVAAPLTDKELTDKNKNLSAKAACVFLLMLIMAAAGWLAENLVRLITKGVIDNRYHALPFIFPYGIAFLAMHLVLGDTNDIRFFKVKFFKKRSKASLFASNVLYIAIVCLFVFLGELGVGNAYEAATGAALWDYTDQPLHLTKYVCLSSALGYGCGAYLLMKFVYYPLLNLLLKRGNVKAVKIADCILGTLVILDSLCMVLILLITKTPPVYWSVKLFG